MLKVVRVVGEINPTGRSDTESKVALNRDGMTSYIVLDQIELLKVYSNMDGMDWEIGGALFDELMFDAGFCKKPDIHNQAWSRQTHDQEDNCDCKFFDQYSYFYIVQLKNGKQYVIHPQEHERLSSLILYN